MWTTVGLRTARTPSNREGVTVVPTKCYFCSRLRTYKWQVVFRACYITISQDVSTGLALHLHFSTCNRQEPGRWIEEWGHPDGICVSSSLWGTLMVSVSLPLCCRPDLCWEGSEARQEPGALSGHRWLYCSHHQEKTQERWLPVVNGNRYLVIYPFQYSKGA